MNTQNLPICDDLWHPRPVVPLGAASSLLGAARRSRDLEIEGYKALIDKLEAKNNELQAEVLYLRGKLNEGYWSYGITTKRIQAFR